MKRFNISQLFLETLLPASVRQVSLFVNRFCLLLSVNKVKKYRTQLAFGKKTNCLNNDKLIETVESAIRVGELNIIELGRVMLG